MPYRILLIDDDFDGLEPIASFLCAEGHHVRASTREGDLLQLVEMVDPDILIVDLARGEADLTAVEMVRCTRPNLEIIAISHDQHLLVLASKRGASRELAKPFRPEKLNLLIKLAMRDGDVF